MNSAHSPALVRRVKRLVTRDYGQCRSFQNRRPYVQMIFAVNMLGAREPLLHNACAPSSRIRRANRAKSDGRKSRRDGRAVQAQTDECKATGVPPDDGLCREKIFLKRGFDAGALHAATSSRAAASCTPLPVELSARRFRAVLRTRSRRATRRARHDRLGARRRSSLHQRHPR